MSPLRTMPMREITALIQLLAMGQIYPFALPDGRKYSIGVECYDYRSGETYCYVLAWMNEDGQEIQLGKLDFSIWRDTVHIKNTEVDPAYKRMGVGRNMMQVLKQETGHPIDPGYTTDEGTPFLDQIRKENPDWFVTPDEPDELQDA